MQALADTLVDLGFTADDSTKNYLEHVAHDKKLTDSGPYVVQQVFSRAGVTVTIEQNTCPEDMGGGMTAVVSHPPCAIIDSPKGRVAFNPTDIDLAVTLLNDLA
jgi:hypothetical protein